MMVLLSAGGSSGIEPASRYSLFDIAGMVFKELKERIGSDGVRPGFYLLVRAWFVLYVIGLWVFVKICKE